MMIRIFWLQAVRMAWTSYVNRMNIIMKPGDMDSYLGQKIDMDMTLEEFAEMVFIKGFAAGEKYSRGVMPGSDEREHRLN